MITITGTNNLVLVENTDGTFNEEIELANSSVLITGGDAHEFNTKEELRTFIAGQNVDKFPTIPAEGEWCEAKVYKYGDNKAKCIQPHTRTFRTPEEEPALWTVIKTVSSYDDVEVWNGSNWLAYQTVGYLVKHNNKIWASKLPISHTWIAPALEGDGSISWEFVADV